MRVIQQTNTAQPADFRLIQNLTLNDGALLITRFIEHCLYSVTSHERVASRGHSLVSIDDAASLFKLSAQRSNLLQSRSLMLSK